MNAPSSPTDVVVLGGGPGGYSCALRLTDHGLSVTLVEGDRVGGTCLNRGCVPTRTMLHAASFVDAATRGAARWGIDARVDGIDLPALVAARDDIVNRNHGAVERHLERAGVQVVRGRGRLVDARTVVVDGDEVRAGRAIVVATGSVPRPVPQVPLSPGRVITSDEAFALDRVPASLTVVGGGAIGAEFSQVWRALGSEVHLVEAQATLVPTEDPAIGKELGRALRKRGIALHVGTTPIRTAVTDAGVELELTSGEVVAAELVVLAAGRVPATADVGLDGVGVRLDAGGAVQLRDPDRLETHAAGVHAIGDVLPAPALMRAHAAYAEGLLAADAIAGLPTTAIDYDGLPRITHGMIETAAVGLSEEEARRRHGDVTVTTLPLAAVAKGLMYGEGGMVKVVSLPDGGIVGVHLVGPHVTELIGEAALIVDFEALPSDLVPIVHAHPTLSEAIGEVAWALAGRPLHLR